MKRFTLLVIALLLCSCAPSQSSVETAIAQTQLAIPTATQTREPSNVVYIAKLKIAIPSWLSAYEQLENHIRAAQENRLLLLDDTWNAELNTYLDNLSGASQVIANMQPVPKNFEKTNEYLQKSAEETILMVEAYRAVFDGSTSTMADQVNDHSDNALLYMNLAAKEAEKYIK